MTCLIKRIEKIRRNNEKAKRTSDMLVVRQQFNINR